MGIFDRRVAFKPFEYPEITEYKSAINHSYWLVSEWNFLSDIHDFNVNLTEEERNVIRNAMLAISQIEVSVKRFWSDLGNRFPKSEFEQVGITFGECEVRHADAYSHLLQVLGLNDEFTQLLQNPVIQGRVDYLSKYLKKLNTVESKGFLNKVTNWIKSLFGKNKKNDDSNKNFAFTLALFSIFVENVSLFSQFLVIKSFNKNKNVLKDIDNVVQATQKEELIHALFGIWIINQIKKEYPEWFTKEFYDKLYQACYKAYEAESKIVDWIFEKGELSFLSKSTVKEFVKNRFNESLEMIGGDKIFDINHDELSKIGWFDDEIYADVNTDFFYKKPVTYSKKTQAINAEDIF